MTSDMRWTDRLAIEIAECKRIGIKVLGPDINQSYADFGIVGGEKTIRFGLAAIKSMGKALIEEIVIPERDHNGPFKSVCDFASRVDNTTFNKKSWESAIKTGAFDRFASRTDLLFNLEDIQAYGGKIQKDRASGQTDLFGLMGDAGAVPEPEIKPSPSKVSEKEQLLWERDLMGLYLSAHPLDKYDVYFEENTHPFSVVSAENDGKQVIVGGIVTGIRTILTKSNTKMAFVKIESKTSETEFIVFPALYEQEGSKLAVDNIIKVTGRVNARDKDGNITSEVKIIADSFSIVSDEKLENYQSTGARLDDPKEAPKKEFRRKKTASVPENIAARLSGNQKSDDKNIEKKESNTEKSDEKAGKTDSKSTKPENEKGTTSISATTNTSNATKTSAATNTSNATKTSATTSEEPVRRIITPPADPRSQRLYVLIEDPEDTAKLTRIRKLCDDNPGFQEIILVLKDESGKKPMRMPFKIDASSELIDPLKALVGDSSVVLK